MIVPMVNMDQNQHHIRTIRMDKQYYDFSEKELKLGELLASLPFDEKRKEITNLMSLAAGMEPNISSSSDIDWTLTRTDLKKKAKKEAKRLEGLYPDLKELITLILEVG